jgi:group I intron endonuclease
MSGAWSVYIHTSPSNKVYVGITSQNPLKRWGNGNNYSKHRYFFAAIQKYGWDNFKHEILFYNLTESDAKQKEIELIARYKSNNREFGYNLTQGGDGVKGYVHTEKTKKKIGEVVRERYSTPEARKELSIRMKGENNPFYNKQLSEEHKEKIKLSHLGKKREPHTQETKAKISAANMGKKKLHLGVPRTAECREKLSITHSKAVLQFSKNGEFICEYPSGKEAALVTGTAPQNISRCCLGKSKTANGFIWKLKNI